MESLIEGKYEVLGKLNEGGMGAVYKVRHVLLDEIRVVKVMKPRIQDDEDSRRRFFQEAKMATALKHPNIALVFDFAEDDDGTFYMVLEYIEGLNLSDYLERYGLPSPRLVIETGIQTLKALAYLHRNGIVHRDISPENIMLTRNLEGGLLVKLIDLGVAKRIEGTPLTTASGVFVGKLHYGSPEQFGALKGAERLDGRSDLYSLGCVLYLLLTGKHAFSGEDIQQLASAHLFHPPLPFESSDPEGRIPEPLREAILRALMKNRTERWATAEEMAEALRRCEPFLDPGGLLMPPSLGPDQKVQKAITERMDTGLFQKTPGKGKKPSVSPTSLPTERVTAAGERSVLGWTASLLGGAFVFLLGAYLYRTRVPAPAPVVPSPTVGPAAVGIVLLTAAPWATVVSVRDASGKEPPETRGIKTPARLLLPPGTYTARLSFKGQEFDVAFESRVMEVVNVQGHAPGFSAREEAREYVP